jgi:hypothetical protein
MFRPAWALALLLLGCADSTAGAPGGTGEPRISIAPTSLDLVVGTTYLLSVHALSPDGNPVPFSEMLWSTSNPAVAHAEVDGRVYAQAPGRSTITLRVDQVTAQVQVNVLTAPVAKVKVDPSAVALAVGAQRTVTAQATDQTGQVVNGTVPIWSTDNPSIATVNALGQVTAVSAGSTYIRAMVAGVQGVAEVDVGQVVDLHVVRVRLSPTGANLGVGQGTKFTATPLNAAGGVVPGLTASWTAQDPAIATVTPDGTVTGVADGVTHIVATIAGVSASASVNVMSNAPPPGTWPNEPSGYSPVSNQPWDLLTQLGWVLQFGTATITPDLSAPASPPNVLTIIYPPGFVGGSAPGTLARDLPTRPQRLFVGTWWKASDPWQGHQSNVNKLLFLFPEAGGGHDPRHVRVPGGSLRTSCAAAIRGDRERLAFAERGASSRDLRGLAPDRVADRLR